MVGQGFEMFYQHMGRVGELGDRLENRRDAYIRDKDYEDVEKIVLVSPADLNNKGIAVFENEPVELKYGMKPIMGFFKYNLVSERFFFGKRQVLQMYCYGWHANGGPDKNNLNYFYFISFPENFNENLKVFFNVFQDFFNYNRVNFY